MVILPLQRFYKFMNDKKAAREKKQERDYDKLLQLIEEGDPTTILSEENISKGFNELLNHGFIVLEEGKILITELGKEAKKYGVKTVILREQLKSAAIEPQPIAPLPKDLLKPGRRKFWILVLIFLFMLTIFATMNLLKK